MPQRLDATDTDAADRMTAAAEAAMLGARRKLDTRNLGPDAEPDAPAQATADRGRASDACRDRRRP
jgi:hypothetical protein